MELLHGADITPGVAVAMGMEVAIGESAGIDWDIFSASVLDVGLADIESELGLEIETLPTTPMPRLSSPPPRLLPPLSLDDDVAPALYKGGPGIVYFKGL